MTDRVRYLSGWGLVLLLAAPCVGAQDAHWGELPLRASSERLALAVGLEPPVESWRLLFGVSSRIHPASGGQASAGARLQAVQAELARDRPSEEDSSALLAPVPLAPDLWRQAVFDQPVAGGELARALLLDRAASLVYRAVSQLDPETLAFFSRHPELLRRVRIRQPEVFALVAGSLQVEGGRVVVPGGTAAVPLWEGLVGAEVAQPERFLARLLTAHEGRSAILLHAVNGLDPARQRFALSLAVTDPGRRHRRFRALARVFARAPRWWRTEEGSPMRPLFDPASLLGRVAVTEDGALAPPAARAFWQAAFADGAAVPDAASLSGGPPADAAWLAEQIALLPTPLARPRVMQLTFAQRVFPAASPESLPQALATVRQVAHRPALVLVLERLGLEEPSLYESVLRAAEALEAVPRGERRTRTLTQFEGALAALDRARQTGVLAPVAVQSLVASLARLRPTRLGYWDPLTSWLDHELVPALATAVGVAQPLGAEEEVWLRALAGFRAEATASPVFDWEGLPTRADPAAGERTRLAGVRRRQGGNSLEIVLAFARLARAVALDRDREEALASLRAMPIDPSRHPSYGRTPSLPAVVSEAELGRLDSLLRLSGGLLAETLASLAYAPHLGQAAGTVLAGANVARRHDLTDQPFALPEEITGTGAPWHVRGSLLALEVALAPLRLRRITPDLPLHPPAFDRTTLASFALSVGLRSPFAMRDADARAVLAAIERGRNRVRVLLVDSSGSSAVARDAALEPWRAQALPWLLAHEPAALDDFFSLAELLRLGGPVALPEQAWGLPELALGGGLRLRRPPPLLLQRAVGQDRRELLAAALEDPLLKVAIELQARRLPASLAGATLALLTQSIADEGPQELADDPLALGRFLRTLPSARFDDYVSALAGDGPLVPAGEPPEGP